MNLQVTARSALAVGSWDGGSIPSITATGKGKLQLQVYNCLARFLLKGPCLVCKPPVPVRVLCGPPRLTRLAHVLVASANMCLFVCVCVCVCVCACVWSGWI